MTPPVNPTMPGEVESRVKRSPRADAVRNHDAVARPRGVCFARRGLEVSMVEIAREAGVGVGTVYRCFPTKDALHLAVVEHGFDGLSDAATLALAAPDPGPAVLRLPPPRGDRDGA